MTSKIRLNSKDYARYEAMSQLEQQLWQEGFLAIAGIDEAGRGPLAGPVYAAACILDPAQTLIGLNDSKKLSEAKREWLAEEIKSKAFTYNIAFVEAQRIDEINILEATKEAMREAVRGLAMKPDILVIDALSLPDVQIPQRALTKGDSLSISIAAASILAKTARDEKMRAYGRQFPEYGFEQHKGYGTKAHYAAIKAHGFLEIHRLSFLKKLKGGSSVSTKQLPAFPAVKAVAEHLSKQNFHILERNFVLRPYSEVDLIASKGNYLYFIAVKAGRREQDGTGVDDQKLSGMRLLAKYYAQSRGYTQEEIVLLAACCELEDHDHIKHICYTDLACDVR